MAMDEDLIEKLALARRAPFSFGNTSEGRMILDKDGHYFCYVHVEQAGGGAISSVVEDMRRNTANALLAMLNALPSVAAILNEAQPFDKAS
jgi:hypothetical protein